MRARRATLPTGLTMKAVARIALVGSLVATAAIGCATTFSVDPSPALDEAGAQADEGGSGQGSDAGLDHASPGIAPDADGVDATAKDGASPRGDASVVGAGCMPPCGGTSVCCNGTCQATCAGCAIGILSCAGSCVANCDNCVDKVECVQCVNSAPSGKCSPPATCGNNFQGCACVAGDASTCKGPDQACVSDFGYECEACGYGATNGKACNTGGICNLATMRCQ